MKNDDRENLKSLLSIFTGYQVGVALAILLGVLAVTSYVVPGAVIPLLILVVVLIVPFLFITE